VFAEVHSGIDLGPEDGVKGGAVLASHQARTKRVNLKSELFTYDIDGRWLAHARLMGRKALRVTHPTDPRPEEIVSGYKSLADKDRANLPPPA